MWKWVDETSFFITGMKEGASFSELAFTSFLEVFAWLGLVV
jgi:hypothetical protein